MLKHNLRLTTISRHMLDQANDLRRLAKQHGLVVDRQSALQSILAKPFGLLGRYHTKSVGSRSDVKLAKTR
jgi:hypothetical protein